MFLNKVVICNVNVIFLKDEIVPPLLPNYSSFKDPNYQQNYAIGSFRLLLSIPNLDWLMSED